MKVVRHQAPAHDVAYRKDQYPCFPYEETVIVISGKSFFIRAVEDVVKVVFFEMHDAPGIGYGAKAGEGWPGVRGVKNIGCWNCIK